MRIGTWNLQGRQLTDDHRALITAANCDVWLFTEIHENVTLDGYNAHRSTSPMLKWKSWAAVFSRQKSLAILPDPHPASAAVTIDGITYCSSILPWRSCGTLPPWTVGSLADRTLSALTPIEHVLSPGACVWGGDWNHALCGTESSGSMEGRKHIEAVLKKFNLKVPTTHLPHRLEGGLSIDHIAIDQNRKVLSAKPISAQSLSDHDAYVIEIE